MELKNRKNNRLQNYDYSQNGMYFVTICTKNREELFGGIKNGKMILNELGKIVQKCYLEIPKHFDNIYLDQYVIMPNHVHGIIEINFNINVGNAYMRSKNTNRTKMLLSKIVQGFKAAVTRMENGYDKNNKKERVYAFPTIWQKSFYDHIIRNEISLNKIREYILNNPKNWEQDRNNVENIWM
ncbi:MAG TPA: transposase [Candidatus Moranbacteria bacterium]|nr:transposase [Candidatus Moranbacteria bacterium]